MAKRIAVVAAGAGLVALVAVGGALALRDGDDGPAVIVVREGGGTLAGSEARDASMIAPAFPQEFVVTVELPVLDGPARSWRYPADGRVTLEQVQRLAGALGLTGTAVEVPADEGGGWRVGPPDGSGPSLTVTASAIGDWWFSGDPATGVARCAIAAPDEPTADDDASGEGTGEGTSEVVCEEPTPPEGVPDEATALAEGRRILEAAGVDLDTAELSVTGDEWGRTVVATTRIGGMAVPLQHSVTFGGGGAVQWAGGSLLAPVPADDYPRIGTAAALERLREGRLWWGGPAVLGADDLAVASGQAEREAEEPAVDEPGLPEPAQPEPAVEEPFVGEPVVITLTGVEETLSLVWAADGTVWLLPSYTFTSDDGGRWEVPAVPDEYLQQEPAPQPAPEPQPAPAPAPSEEPGSAPGS